MRSAGGEVSVGASDVKKVAVRVVLKIPVYLSSVLLSVKHSPYTITAFDKGRGREKKARHAYQIPEIEYQRLRLLPESQELRHVFEVGPSNPRGCSWLRGRGAPNLGISKVHDGEAVILSPVTDNSKVYDDPVEIAVGRCIVRHEGISIAPGKVPPHE